MPPKGDIRSFFTSLTSKSSSKSPGAADQEDDGAKKKKKPLVIKDSDSDSDGKFVSPVKKVKKEKASPRKEAKKEQPSRATKIKAQKKAEIEQAPLKPVDISAVFGSSPIKRSKDGTEKRKRSTVTSDDEAKTPKKSPEAVPTKKSKVTESPKKEKSQTPSPSKENKSKNITEIEKSPGKTVKQADQPKEQIKKEDRRTRSSKIKYVEESDDDDIVLATPKPPSKSKSLLSKTRKVMESDEDDDVVMATPKQSPVKRGKKEAEKPLKKVESDKKKSPAKKVKEEPMDTDDTETPKKTSHAPDATASPSFDPLEKRKQHAENYRKFLASHKEGAKNPGSKPVPDGAPNCLSGLTIVVTGVLESLHREQAEELIKKYGGKATKSVSKNTSYILAGDDAGPSKLSKAKDLNVGVISEDDFLNMIATRPAGSGVGSPAPARGRAATTPRSEKKAIPARSVIKSEPIEADASPAKKKSPDIKKSPAESRRPAESTRTAEASALKTPSEPSVPWVDKYKPSNLKQVIGMQGDRSNAKKLLYWLQNWFDNHGSGHKKHARPSPWSTNDDGSYFKAALLSGPPGVGKTTTAHLAAKELGFDEVEMNASDTRSKRLLHERVTELLSSKSLASYAHGSQQIENGRKRLLIMDEVDGMAGNEDRGGMQELIGLIKSSKVPIICICNDRQHPKVRSLANYCYDLKFSKPRVEQIRGAMLSVCFKEGFKLKPDALDEIIVGANQDVRQVLNHLSILAKSESQSITSEQAKREASKSKKDFKLGPWDVVRRVFSADEHKGMSINDKSSLFFQDYSFGPLFVQENYPLVVPHAAKGDAKKTLDLLARTADCMSVTDLIEKTIRSQNAWSLLPVEAMFASVIPGQLMEGHVGGQIQFPSWLGKNSRQNKMDRLLQELQIHMRLRISGSKRAVNLDYLPLLVDAIVGPLKRQGAAGVESAVKAMENYDLMREDLDSLLEVAQWPNRAEIMAGVDGKVKAAFTRAYNKEAHLTPYAAGQVKVGRSRAAAGADDAEGLEGLDGEEAPADDENDDDDDPTRDAMIKVKKSTKKEASAATKKASGTKGSKGESSGAAKSGRGGGTRGRGRGRKAAE